MGEGEACGCRRCHRGFGCGACRMLARGDADASACCLTLHERSSFEPTQSAALRKTEAAMVAHTDGSDGESDGACVLQLSVSVDMAASSF